MNGRRYLLNYLSKDENMENANVKENKMGTMPVFKLLISMALPMVISMLIQSLYNVVDSIFVGKFSNDALTAIGLAWPMPVFRSNTRNNP